MKIKTWRDPEASDLLEIEGKHWLLHTICEWRQLWGKWNWINFTVVQVYAERDICLPGFEFTAILLGLGFRFRINGDWNTTKTGRNLLDFDRARESGNLKHTKGECPFCDGTGECRSCKGTGEVGIVSVEGSCKKCGYRQEDCECRDDNEGCGNPNCYEC